MATAPFQLWLDLAAISSAERTSSTVTVTTTSPHGLSTGAYVQMDGASGVAGTSMNGVYQITATSGTTFTYTSAGSPGTGGVGSAVISNDLFNPLINFSGTAKNAALYVPTDAVGFSLSGDGSGASSSMQVLQDDTPADGPWYTLIPDQARVRIIKADTGSTPAGDGSDVLFNSAIANITSRLNGAGQGSITDVVTQDATSLLDRLIIYTDGVRQSLIAANGAVLASNLATITTSVGHGLSTGGTVQIAGEIGAGTVTFNANSIAGITVTAPNQFTYSKIGADQIGNSAIIPTAIARTANPNEIKFTLPTLSHFDDVAPVVVSGVTSSSPAAANLINDVFGGNDITGSHPDFTFTLAGTIAGTPSFDISNATIASQGVVTPFVGGFAGTSFPMTVTLAAGLTETELVADVLGELHKIKGGDAAVQRLLNTSGTAKIVGATSVTNKQEIVLDATSVRAVLDEVVAIFEGIDGKPRRYFVDSNALLNYGLSDPDDAPTYATAPYKIITSGTQNPDTTTGAATLIPYGLQVSYDFQTTKSGLVTTDFGTAYTPIVSSYRNFGYAERKGAAAFDSFITTAELPTGLVAEKYVIGNYRFGKSFYAQAHKPLLSGVFTLRGAGDAAHNQYGFNAGYAQTGASTFALVSRWLPGQFVDITCAELDLSGMYRVEQVDWSLEPGSFTQIISIVFSSKPQYSLSAQLAKLR